MLQIETRTLLEEFCAGSVGGKEFVASYYRIVDSISKDTEKWLAGLIERYHYWVGCYEPDSSKRMGIDGLVDEEQLRMHMAHMLKALKEQTDEDIRTVC